jgi:hypothetical protein
MNDELRKTDPALMYCPSIYLEEQGPYQDISPLGWNRILLNMKLTSVFICLFMYLFEEHSIDPNQTRP